jgi:hypothetical protein
LLFNQILTETFLIHASLIIKFQYVSLKVKLILCESLASAILFQVVLEKVVADVTQILLVESIVEGILETIFIIQTSEVFQVSSVTIYE